MDLVIVESPTKAKTLSRFLGKGYELEATMGHIKDLPKTKLGIDVEKNFKPEYVLIEKKIEAIEKIKKAAKKAGKIYLATDPDREGEAIAMHVKDELSGKQISRIVFHEITKTAVEKAIKNPRAIDKNLVEAQISRRVLDRLVGYKLSPLLWKKIRRGLSAGRVQSVTVRLIVEREREIEKFKPVEYWEIFCELKTPRAEQLVVKLIKIDDEKADIKNKKTAEKVISDLKKTDYKVSDVKKREVRRNPYPPFITSTMAQGCARLFFWSAKKTMSVAQKLYEEGLITYHRTDSTFVSETAIEKVRNYIKKEVGKEYLSVEKRIYKTKSKVAQEAHEAIRPTRMARATIQDSRFKKDAEMLYGLIWKRFVASQMAASIYDETVIEVLAKQYLLRVGGQIMKFDGWRKILSRKKENGAVQLPEVSVNEVLQLIKVNSDQKFTEPPARFNEASLIKTLEKLEIGRPSTYAPIISTIQFRNYVEKKEGRFYPTPVGVAVNDFLIKNFPDVFEYQFTAEMEDGLDKIAAGKSEWETSMKKFWNPFEKKLKDVEKNSKRVKIETEKLGKKCPKCKKGELVIRIGRFGKFISCSRFPDCDYTEKYLEKIGMKCPDCKKGDVIVKKTRKERQFFGCSRYPDCEFASWKNPKVRKKKQS